MLVINTVSLISQRKNVRNLTKQFKSVTYTQNTAFNFVNSLISKFMCKYHFMANGSNFHRKTMTLQMPPGLKPTLAVLASP